MPAGPRDRIPTRYGFAIGNVAAFDMGNDEAIVSPGGVGFGTARTNAKVVWLRGCSHRCCPHADINCGVRLIRTNLDYKDVEDKKEQIAQTLFNHIPVGVGTAILFCSLSWASQGFNDDMASPRPHRSSPHTYSRGL